VAEWLLEQALVHQRRTLHAGTPGDNVTVVVVRLRPLPPVPRSTGSRLNLRAGGSGELVSPKLADVSDAHCLPVPACQPVFVVVSAWDDVDFALCICLSATLLTASMCLPVNGCSC
jgi:hypothetical protein